MKEAYEVPVCLSGAVTHAHPSLCMDGATHLLDSPLVGTVRLLATNDDAKKALEDFTDAKVAVVVCGYPRRSANCSHMEVYWAGIAANAKEHLEAIADKVGNG